MNTKPEALLNLITEYRDNGERLREISDGLKATVEEHQTTIAVLSDALSESRRVNAELLALVRRYRTETPLGHQPHMIAHEADAAIAKATGDQA